MPLTVYQKRRVVYDYLINAGFNRKSITVVAKSADVHVFVLDSTKALLTPKVKEYLDSLNVKVRIITSKR